MKKVIDFPGCESGEEAQVGRTIRVVGGRVLDFRPELVGARQDVEDQNNQACWLNTHFGLVHQSELVLFDEVQILAEKLFEALIREGEERGAPLVTAKTGFLRELGVFLLARGRRGELGQGVCEAGERFGKRIFPQEVVDEIRCNAVRSLYGAPRRKELPRGRMPSILEVLDHFMPTV